MTKTAFSLEGFTAKPIGPERRRRRRTKFPSQKVLLTIEQVNYDRYAGAHADFRPPQVVAKLVDISDAGLGLETLFSLPLGFTVLVSCEIHSPNLCMGLQCRARVVQCQLWGNLNFRVGLSYEDMNYRRLLCAHQTYDALGPPPLLLPMAGPQPSGALPAEA